MNTNECLIKIFLIGDNDVGKSSILKQFIDRKFDDITFIVSQKQIQINNRKLSILSSDFNKSKSKKTLESPLGTLNFVEENGLSKLYKAKTFVTKNQESREYSLNKILKDIITAHTILIKYGITLNQIDSMVFENLREMK